MIVAITERSAAPPHRLSPVSGEAIAAAQQLAAALALPVSAVALEPTPEDSQAPAESAAARLAMYRLDRVYLARHAALGRYDPEIWVPALVQVLAEAHPRYVVLPHTYQARDFAPQLATRLGSGLISDVTALRVENGRVVLTRPLFQGKLAAEVSFRGEAAGFFTVQAGAFPAEGAERSARPAPVVEIAVSPPPSRLSAGEVYQESKPSVDLSQASAIVAAGRGIKEAKHLALIRRLAAALGAEVAASRPICDAGWLPIDRQVGSSGHTVAPKLYVAIGISGAIQHLVGMKGARTIVAINRDPTAPIFEAADYGIVGDLFEVVPALIAALEAPPAE